jgi:predicted dehydrogenase
MNVAIVGCGLIGQKRAASLGLSRLTVCADIDLSRAEQLARRHTGCVATADWRDAVTRPDVSLAIVATRHDSLAEITRCAVEAGKHVLVEKPAGRCASEIRALPALAAHKGVLVHVGFNHRYHRAFRQARLIVDSGALGPLMFLRARYGHGGRIGYEKEWRALPEVSGGGELIDQGVHIIDLARWFLGDFTEIDGFAHTYYWNAPVDDNAFMLLKTARRQVAFLHASSTEWKNTFSFELYGRAGKLQVDGLGGSYGVERLAFYRMLPEMGPPETTIWEYPMADDSWEVEMTQFLDEIQHGRQSAAGLNDAVAALDVVDAIYQRSEYDHRA